MKKLLCMLLVAMLAMTAIGFTAMAEEDNWKIAILTGTTTQGEEEYRAAQKMVATYGEDHILTDTYPDNFSSETETTIQKVLSFAADPDVKAIIFVQGVQGATAAFTQIKEDLGRDDILLITGVTAEDPADICGAADIVFQTDDINIAEQIIAKCDEWDVDVFVHYSFARHLSYETIVARRTLFMEYCDEYGIEFVDRDCPDPTGEAGTTGAQNYILEDIPLVMEEYAGKKVAFFNTNCSMQLSMQMAILEQPNAYYPMPCCPSPFHYFPDSLGVEADENAYNDIEGYISKLAAKLQEHDALGRYSTWACPINMSMIIGGTAYAIAYAKGETNGKVDEEKLISCFSEAMGYTPEVSYYENADGQVYENMFMLLFQPIDFADYLA